jgi:hypothetical protein
VDLATGTLEDSIELDFFMACVDLAEARRAALAADTPAARARLSGCADVVDALLDMSNDAASTGRAAGP